MMNEMNKSESKDDRNQHVVMSSISDFELMDMTGIVPMAVQLRQKLNKAGFRFKDDNSLSSVVNENPEPLGEFVSWHDIQNQTTHYKQIITT
jgi:hypothetical protein